MSRNPPMQLVFPAGGVVRRLGVRNSNGGTKPYPTPWAMNVRLEDSITDRLRGGSFTAIDAAARPSEILYRDRVLTFSGRAITATRMGDHTDTTLSSDVSDSMRPALFQLSEAGEQGETVVALVPHKDRYLLGFSAGETWSQHGDPLTGSRHCVSREVGIIGADAWCKAHDTVYFMSEHGLYSVGADGSGMQPVSEDTIPVELTGISDTDCTLTYNHGDRGVYIHLTDSPSWFYDIARNGFWPFNSSSSSHVLLGPLFLSRENAYGRIQNIQGNIASGSGDVTWRLVTGTTAEAAADNGKAAITAFIADTDYQQYVSSSGVWGAGRSHMAYPRTRAIWCCVWLSAAADWAYESVAMTVMSSGLWR